MSISNAASSAPHATSCFKTSFFKKSVHAVRDMGVGAGRAVVEQGKDVVLIARHPKRTAEGVSELVTHPARTLEALARDEGGPAGPERSKAEQVGHLVGGVGLGVLTMGGGTAVSVARTVSGSARSTDSVAAAARRGEAAPSEGPVSFGGVFKGATAAALEPARDTFHAMSHPVATAKGLTAAARHPQAAYQAANQRPAALPPDGNRDMGRGIVRLGAMSVGVAFGSLGQARDAAKSGQQVDRIANAPRPQAP